jgi:hypothetical protein
MEMFFRQAAMNPSTSRPAFVALGVGEPPYQNIMRNLEDSGCPALIVPPAVISAALNGIPDSFGRPIDDELATFVRAFKCEGAIEKGDPGCDAQKWTPIVSPSCKEVKYRTSWHPGW